MIAWEPVPQFRAFLAYNRRLNHLESLVEIRDTAVVEVGGRLYNLTVPQRGIWGTAGIDGLNIDRSVCPSVCLSLHMCICLCICLSVIWLALSVCSASLVGPIVAIVTTGTITADVAWLCDVMLVCQGCCFLYASGHVPYTQQAISALPAPM